MSEAIETTEQKAAPSLFERRFQAKITKLYAKTAEQKRRGPILKPRADAKRARKAAKRLRSIA